MTFRRSVVTSLGVGAVAGCLGTWLEMSHGVVCMPVLTLPPFMLSHPVAIGSTVFGVAARQLLATGLYALDPNSPLDDQDKLEELIDVGTASRIAAAGSVSAWLFSAVTGRLAFKSIQKLSGVFLCAVAVGLSWRDAKVRNVRDAIDSEMMRRDDANRFADGPMAKIQRAKAAEEGLLDSGSQTLLEAGKTSHKQQLSHIILGLLSGACVGMFGIGPAWLVAPILSMHHETDVVMGWKVHGRLSDEEIAGAVTESSGADERSRRTATFAMIGPCLVSAFRHYVAGNVPTPTAVALPLAVGAIAGSAAGGMALADTECAEEVKFAVAVLLFLSGAWSFFRPS